jgi:hypothetical protein
LIRNFVPGVVPIGRNRRIGWRLRSHDKFSVPDIQKKSNGTYSSNRSRRRRPHAFHDASNTGVKRLSNNLSPSAVPTILTDRHHSAATAAGTGGYTCAWAE